jgi:hypothetical protein
MLLVDAIDTYQPVVLVLDQARYLCYTCRSILPSPQRITVR